MIGTNIFLQGSYLEVGVCPNGSWGATPAPAGYHPFGVAPNLAQMYDYGHDGWAVGAPASYGDFTYPGTPFEGWSMQVNGVRSDAFYTTGAYNGTSFTGSLTGANVSYTNVAGVITGTWQGTCSGLNVTQATRIDQGAGWAVVTTTFTNPTGAAIPGVYYWRTCDPDNDETHSGNFATNNMIVYQNDVDHRVMVNSTGTVDKNAYMALCTKDCRAKSMIYVNWASYPAAGVGNSLDKVYNQTATGLGATYYNVTYPTFTTAAQDIAIGLIYNIGTIPAGGRAVISYAYTFGTGASAPIANYITNRAAFDNSIDSAFPEPILIVNGIPGPPSGPAPAPTYDTFRACQSGLTTLPVNINFASDKDWTWSTWTWSPGIGLASTTGVTNTITLSALPPIITYTITGTDSNVNMYSCNQRVMYLTIITCNGAVCNSPCIGDTLKFNAPGDSTGATYSWYGPAPSTTVVGTSQSFFIYPSTWADTGTYHVIKTVGAVSDTASTTVIIHPLPDLILTSNIPNCTLLTNTLSLGVNPDSLGETFSWTGPNGFTSTLEFPIITPFDSTGAGTYTVNATTIYGCKNSNSINIYPGIVPGFSYVIHRGCNGDDVTFTNLSFNANTYSWNFGDGTPPVTTRNAVHHFATQGVWTVILTCNNPHCVATISHDVDTKHTVTADFSANPDTFCFFNPVQFTTLTDNSSATVDTAVNVTVPGLITSYSWNFGDGVTDITANPTHTYAAAGVYQITLIVIDSIGCPATMPHNVVVLRVDIKSFHDTTLCLRQPLPLNNTVTLYPDVSNNFTYSWTESSPNLDYLNIQVPHLSGFGMFTDILTATIQPWGCYAIDTITVHSVLGKLLTNVSPDAVIPYGSSIQLNSDNELYYYWIPNDGSLDNPNINNPNATPTQTTIYTVYGMDQYGCVDSAFVTITVDSTMNEGIPSAFTPNGDGLNDVFRPVGIKYQRLIEFRIFNRWGQQVFYSNNINDAWDGTFNGVPQDMGVYNYVVIIAKPGNDNHEGLNIVYKGNVTLLR